MFVGRRIALIFALLCFVPYAPSARAAGEPAVPPGLVFSTNLGTSGYATPAGVASNADGDLYVVGSARNAVFPGSPRVTVLGALGGDSDIFVMKLAASGAAVEFVTLVGGSGQDQGQSVALDAAGNVYVAAVTSSADLPVDGVGSRPYAGALDVYVAKLSADGASLLSGTYLGGGGDDTAPRVVIDAAGRACVALSSRSADFPVTTGPAPSPDAYSVVAVAYEPSGGRIAYARTTSLTGVARRAGLAADADGNVYVAAPGSVTRLGPDGAPIATAERELYYACAAVGPNGDVYTAALDDPDDPAVIYVDRWTSDLAPTEFEVKIFPRYRHRVALADLAVDSDANVYLADFEDGDTENYYSPLRRVDARGRLVFEAPVTDKVVGLSLSSSRRVGVVGEAYFEWPTMNALVANRGEFRDGFVAQFAFPTETGAPPTVTSVERRPKKANPNRFRIVVRGTSFRPGAVVFLGDATTPAAGWTVKSDTKLVLNGELSTENGPVALTIVNPDGGEVTATYGN